MKSSKKPARSAGFFEVFCPLLRRERVLNYVTLSLSKGVRIVIRTFLDFAISSQAPRAALRESELRAGRNDVI